MARRTRLILIVIILFVLILYIAIFLLTNLYGPRINDKYANEQMNVLEALLVSDNMNILESSNFVGKLEDDGQFVVWVGVVIKSSLSYNDLNLILQTMKLPETAKVTPYDLELVNKLHFSGVQKEYWGANTQNLYLVGVERKPPTFIDSRNR